MAMLVSMPAIALVTHQSQDWIERLFAGTVATGERLDAPIVVADNASTDGTVEALRGWQRRSDRLSVIELGANRGYAAGVNAAFAAVPDRDVMLINPDVDLAGAEALEALVELLAERPEVAAAGPRLVGAGGEVQPSARRFPTLAAVAATLGGAERIGALRRSRARYEEPTRASAPVAVDWVMGAAMLIRRSAYEQVGGWDEGYFLYVEDADFCRRLRTAGWEVVYDPSVSVVHGYGRESSSADASVVSSLARRRHIRSFARFWIKDPRSLIGRSAARVR